jgi:hypothetical protein
VHQLPKGGQLGTNLNRDQLVTALVGQGVQPVRQVSISDTRSAWRFRTASDRGARTLAAHVDSNCEDRQQPHVFTDCQVAG